ncbi:MAG: type IV pilus assembly protein PilM [Candidatus Terrybacteria bacterium]|nr:type IV pilus assembly protein PilM [Candidatus Terrybacteria bacterium]
MFDSFFNPKMPVLAIDLSDRSVKFARAKRYGARRRIVGALRADLPDGLVVQGRVQQSEALAKTIRDTLRSPQAKSLRVAGAAMTLPEEHCFVRVVRVPRLPKDELAQAVRWEAEAAIPIPAAEAVLSWEIAEDKNAADHFDVLVAGASRDLVQGYAETLQRVPLVPIAFEPASFAIVRALLAPADREMVLVIDFGREHTGIIIAREHQVLVTANVPIASRVFTERVAAARKISIEQAESAKREVGILPQGEGIATREALAPTLDELVKQIQQFFTFSETHAHVDLPKGALVQGMRVGRVLLSGGEAPMPGLAEYFSQALGVPVAIGDPLRNLFKTDKRLVGHPLFASVVGLALHGLEGS